MFVCKQMVKMKLNLKNRSSLAHVGLEGFLAALSPVPLLFITNTSQSLIPHNLQTLLAFSSMVLCFICSQFLYRKSTMGKTFGVLAAFCFYGSIFHLVWADPFVALLGTTFLLWVLFALSEFTLPVFADKMTNHDDRALQRTLWGAIAVVLIITVAIVLNLKNTFWLSVVFSISTGLAQMLYIQWSLGSGQRANLLLTFAVGVTIFLLFLADEHEYVRLLSFMTNVSVIVMSMRARAELEETGHWWVTVLNHPARILLSSFLVLCVAGTMLLSASASAKSGVVSVVDAAFTSVSAVCVTGLIVLDTPNDFSFLGQFFILVLIQLGGLGIMSITTVGLHAMGKRLSLRHERLLTSVTETDHRSLVTSLATILRFTFIAEGIGAVVLTALFCFAGDSFSTGLWRGIFTAISAFCNAGFALQTDSLISYQGHPFILHTIALLIIVGGMAPAFVLSVPSLVRGKRIPEAARLALVTSVVLLFSGALLILVFEWNGMLAGLTFGDKFQNAWFQSVTLRTAGFNSVELANFASPTFMLMLVFMFIGGSPGGTAGGVKTTTIGVLALTFWANVTNKRDIIYHNRIIRQETINRAVTIVMSGMIICVIAVIMLEVTQQIPSRDLVFEVASAVGTVGLSTGATSMLDEIGKIIVMMAMFAGRVGPMTLFMMLGSSQKTASPECADANVPLT